ncbi:MAG: MFS transporter [Deltaproteobacteria bacterium]|nr:MFS transporter [Deltaproteobacteria bacterium]
MTDKACPIPVSFIDAVGKIIFLTFLFFLSFISRFIFAPLLPSLSGDLGITTAQAGSIFLFGSIGVAAGAMGSGFISSRANHKGALEISVLGAGIVLIACVFSGTIGVVRIVMFLLGIAAGFNLPSNMAVITAIVSRQDWGKALAVQQTAPPLSLILGPLLAAILLPWISWRAILAWIACALIISGILLARFGALGNFPGDQPNFLNIKVILAKRSFWFMLTLFALGIGGNLGIYTMLPLYLVKEHGFGQELANTMVGLSQISTFFMIFAGGWMTDRFGEKRTMAASLIISGALMVLMGTISGVWFNVIIFLEPAAVACFFPAAFAALSRTVQPNLRSLVTSWTTPVAFLIGGGIFPALLGYMGQAYSIGLGIAIAGILMILGSSLVLLLELLDKMEEGC